MGLSRWQVLPVVSLTMNPVPLSSQCIKCLCRESSSILRLVGCQFGKPSSDEDFRYTAFTPKPKEFRHNTCKVFEQTRAFDAKSTMKMEGQLVAPQQVKVADSESKSVMVEATYRATSALPQQSMAVLSKPYL